MNTYLEENHPHLIIAEERVPPEDFIIFIRSQQRAMGDKRKILDLASNEALGIFACGVTLVLRHVIELFDDECPKREILTEQRSQTRQELLDELGACRQLVMDHLCPDSD